VYEEYANEQALKVSFLTLEPLFGEDILNWTIAMQTHGSTPEYQALVKAKDSEDLLNSMEISFMEECKPQDSRL